MKKKILQIGILLFILVFIFSIPKIFSNKKEINNTNNTNKRQFAMYKQKDDKSGYEELTNTTKFPEDYILNLEKSYCLDNNGEIVNGVLSDTNGKPTVASNKTVFCTLYFDVFDGLTPLELVATHPSNLSTSLVGGLYRYQGTSTNVTNNYICFGTSDKSTCLNNQDTYMYRIIGIGSDGKATIIKNTHMPDIIEWYGVYSQGLANDWWWNYATPYLELNGSLFLENTTYVPSGWDSKIADGEWLFSELTGITTAINAYEDEKLDWVSETDKIVLMHVSDYLYQSSDCSNNTNCNQGWLYSGDYEWTFGFETGMDGISPYAINTSGVLNTELYTDQHYIRPMFKLVSTVNLLGKGTSTNPYIINN